MAPCSPESHWAPLSLDLGCLRCDHLSHCHGRNRRGIGQMPRKAQDPDLRWASCHFMKPFAGSLVSYRPIDESGDRHRYEKGPGSVDGESNYEKVWHSGSPGSMGVGGFEQLLWQSEVQKPRRPSASSTIRTLRQQLSSLIPRVDAVKME